MQRAVESSTLGKTFMIDKSKGFSVEEGEGKGIKASWGYPWFFRFSLWTKIIVWAALACTCSLMVSKPSPPRNGASPCMHSGGGCPLFSATQCDMGSAFLPCWGEWGLPASAALHTGAC